MMKILRFSDIFEPLLLHSLKVSFHPPFGQANMENQKTLTMKVTCKFLDIFFVHLIFFILKNQKTLMMKITRMFRGLVSLLTRVPWTPPTFNPTLNQLMSVESLTLVTISK